MRPCLARRARRWSASARPAGSRARRASRPRGDRRRRPRRRVSRRRCASRGLRPSPQRWAFGAYFSGRRWLTRTRRDAHAARTATSVWRRCRMVSPTSASFVPAESRRAGESAERVIACGIAADPGLAATVRARTASVGRHRARTAGGRCRGAPDVRDCCWPAMRRLRRSDDRRRAALRDARRRAGR